jgi:hypothetical protein
LQLADALFDSLRFFPQTLKVFLEPGDLFRPGPKNPVRRRMPAMTAGAAVVAATLTATVVFLGRATHILTPFHFSIC